MSDERARLFVALELPNPVRVALARWCTGPLDRLRPVPREALHVTLCFLGSHRISEIEAIGGVLRALARERAAPLSLGQPVWLPARRPRVLAVGLLDPLGQLARLQAGLSRVLHSGGWYEAEGRAFLPHVTVARVRRGGRRMEVSMPDQLAFEGSRVTVYRSRLGQSGARYEPLRTIELQS